MFFGMDAATKDFLGRTTSLSATKRPMQALSMLHSAPAIAFTWYFDRHVPRPFVVIAVARWLATKRSASQSQITMS
jgi:hypothetical protein